MILKKINKIFQLLAGVLISIWGHNYRLDKSGKVQLIKVYKLNLCMFNAQRKPWTNFDKAFEQLQACA